MSVLIIVAVVAVIAAVAWLSYQQKKKRLQDLSTFASQHRFAFSETDTYGLLSYDFHLFGMGDGRGCENLLTGSWEGMPVKEADYWYYTESTDSQGHRTKTYHYFSVLVTDLQIAVPHVSVSKETLFTRMADHLGFPDIDFESEDFNRAFNVKSKDREFSFKLIDARMMQWLLATGGAFGFEVSGSNLLVYHKRLKPMDLAGLLGTARGFQEHVPQLVWSEYGSPGAAAPAASATAPPAPPIPPMPGVPVMPTVPPMPSVPREPPASPGT